MESESLRTESPKENVGASEEERARGVLAEAWRASQERLRARAFREAQKLAEQWREESASVGVAEVPQLNERGGRPCLPEAERRVKVGVDLQGRCFIVGQEGEMLADAADVVHVPEEEDGAEIAERLVDGENVASLLMDVQANAGGSAQVELPSVEEAARRAFIAACLTAKHTLGGLRMARLFPATPSFAASAPLHHPPSTFEKGLDGDDEDEGEDEGGQVVKNEGERVSSAAKKFTQRGGAREALLETKRRQAELVKKHTRELVAEAKEQEGRGSELRNRGRPPEAELAFRRGDGADGWRKAPDTPGVDWHEEARMRVDQDERERKEAAWQTKQAKEKMLQAGEASVKRRMAWYAALGQHNASEHENLPSPSSRSLTGLAEIVRASLTRSKALRRSRARAGHFSVHHF